MLTSLDARCPAWMHVAQLRCTLLSLDAHCHAWVHRLATCFLAVVANWPGLDARCPAWTPTRASKLGNVRPKLCPQLGRTCACKFKKYHTTSCSRNLRFQKCGFHECVFQEFWINCPKAAMSYYTCNKYCHQQPLGNNSLICHEGMLGRS